MLSSPDRPQAGPELSGELDVLCFCADWCGTCREYRPGFEAMSPEFPGARFLWFDIEDSAEEMGDLDVQNFPTLLIRKFGFVLFWGTMLPHLDHLRRTVELFSGWTCSQVQQYADSTTEHKKWQSDTDLSRIGQHNPAV